MKQYRIEDPQSLDPFEIETLVSEGNQVIIQFSNNKWQNKLLEELNGVASKLDRNLQIRFYGHYQEIFDASVLRLIPDVKCLSIDCLTTAINLEALDILLKQKELHIGIHELDDTNILSTPSLRNLESLTVGDTRKNNVDLSHLANLTELKKIGIVGHTKNIEVVAGLNSVTSLFLSKIGNRVPLDFVSQIKNLENIFIILGGRTSIAEINGEKIKDLKITRVRGLENLGDIGRFPLVESIEIEDQIKLSSISFAHNHRLRRMRIINCKTLERIHGITELESLEELCISQTAIDYQKFINIEMPKPLKKITFHTGKRKQDVEIENDLVDRAYNR